VQTLVQIVNPAPRGRAMPLMGLRATGRRHVSGQALRGGRI
jgi:hypothetical protein